MAKKAPVVTKLSVANNALLEVPAYEKHKRGTNWLAVINVDGTCPGGLSRQWMPRGKGECFYLIEQLKLFDAVEFGADYTTFGGNKHQTRFYGVVVALTESHIMVEECATGAKAVIRAKEARVSEKDRIKALEAERDDLVTRAAKVESEIAALKGEGPANDGEPVPEAAGPPKEPS